MPDMNSDGWMLYGAYGFTGRLIVAEALRRGHRPVLAGRDSRRLETLAAFHGLPFRPLTLEDPAALRSALREAGRVVNAAGPFSETGPKLAEACLDTATSYIDVSGEFHHLRSMAALDAAAKTAGVAILTGAGFGVTYGDCLARYAVDRLPDATCLRLSVAAATAQTTPAVRRTIAGVLSKGGYAVEGGRFRRRALAHQTWKVGTLKSGRRTIGGPPSQLRFAAAPLGELAALQRSTGVADIVVGRAMPAGAARALRLLSPVLRSALSIPAVRQAAGRDRGKPLATAPEPAGGWRSRLWAEVGNDRGDVLIFELTTGEGYAATADAVLANLEALLIRDLRGSFTPGLAFGSALLDSLSTAEIKAVSSTPCVPDAP
jgi:short subunit dehydrogenase-like uncharacterized protein